MPHISSRKPRPVRLDQDYSFRTTPEPTPLADFPQEFRAGLRSGKLALVLRRSCTPNIWTIVKASVNIAPDSEWPTDKVVHRFEPEYVPRLDKHVKFYPRLNYFDMTAECTQLVDYGPLAGYASIAMTSAFADQGKPLWSRYVFSEKKLARAGQRRRKAEKAAAWFNAQKGNEPVKVRKLTDAAVLALAGSKVMVAKNERTSSLGNVYLYRSLADPVLELVRAGFGSVDADGFFAADSDEPVTAAREEKARRRLEVEWVKPAHIEKRIRGWERDPRRGTTVFRRARPPVNPPASVYL